MRALLRVVVILLFCNGAGAFLGFNDPEIRGMIETYAAQHSVAAQAIINAAVERVGDDDSVRFFITSKGELYFMLNESLHAMVPVPVQGGEPRILVCSVLKAQILSKHVAGIVFESEAMSGEQARSGIFCFDFFEDASEGVELLIGDMKATTTVHAARRPTSDRAVARPKKRAALETLAQAAVLHQ